MRWWLAIVFLLCVSAVHATATTGWYYEGDTFTLDGILFSVEGGGDYERVLLDVGGTSHLIQLGNCVKTAVNQYCYLSTAYPDDETHVKYAHGEELFGYQLSFSTTKPTLKVTRSSDLTGLALGKKFEVVVSVENTGEVAAENLVFSEVIPPELDIVNGPTKDLRTIYYSVKSLSPGRKESFKYTLSPKDFLSTTLPTAFSYSYAGQQYNETVPLLSVKLDPPMEVTHTITNEVDLGDTGHYVLSIKNVGDDPLEASIRVVVPANLTVTTLDKLKAAQDGYVGSVDLEDGRSATFSFDFRGNYRGSYPVSAFIDLQMKGISFKRNYTDTVVAKAEPLVPSIRLSSVKNTYTPGEKITASGLLENKNLRAGFLAISGSLTAPGLFAPVAFGHDAFSASKVLTEAEQSFVIPDTGKNFTITLAGTYKTPGGDVLPFNTSVNIITVAKEQSLAVNHAVTPGTATPGQNITVTVTAQNVNSPYFDLVAEEAYDSVFEKIGGITYFEGSLERNAVKQLYIYQLRIPADYAESTLNVTTVATVKGKGTQRFMTAIPVNVVVQQNETPQVSDEVPVAPIAPAQEAPPKEEGFFSGLWKTLKSWFS